MVCRRDADLAWERATRQTETGGGASRGVDVAMAVPSRQVSGGVGGEGSGVGKRAVNVSAAGANVGTPKPTTFEELNRTLQQRTSSLTYRINSVLQVLETHRDDLRGFFSTCYQTLLWQIFNFDDSASGWLQSVSTGNDKEAWILLDFLSPKGQLMKAVLAADADGLMQFAFPLERLPVRTQRLLQVDPGRLNSLLPYRGCVQRDASGRCHVHLGLYHYFLFWSAYYACSAARGSAAGYADGRRRHTHGNASGSRTPWMMDHLSGLLQGSGSQRIQPYRELLLSHLTHFLPRGSAVGWAWGVADAAGWARGSAMDAYRAAGCPGQGELLVSIMIEFWLPHGDDHSSGPMGGAVEGGYHGASDGVGGVRSPYVAGMGSQTRSGVYGSPYGGAMQMQMGRQYAYTPPNEDLVNAVCLLVTYLFSDAPGQSAKDAKRGGSSLIETPSPRSPRDRSAVIPDRFGSGVNGRLHGSPHAGSPPVGQAVDMAEEVERAKEMLRKPLYKFLRDAFTHWPAESTASLGPLLNLWMSYLTPWTLSFPEPPRLRSRGGGHSLTGSGSPLSRGLETERKTSHVTQFAGDALQKSPRTPEASGSGRWGKAPSGEVDDMHVLHNIPFYSELMRHFLELCCNRVPVDAEGTATALHSVLRALAACPKVLEVLEGVEGAFNTFLQYTPSPTADPLPPTPYDAFLSFIQTQLLDWEPPTLPNQGAAHGALGSGGDLGGRLSMPIGGIGPPGGMRPIGGHHGSVGGMGYHHVDHAPPAAAQQLLMFSVHQDGLPHVVLAILDRLDRDASVLGNSHPLRARVPKLRRAAFSVFRLERLGEPLVRTPSLKTTEFTAGEPGEDGVSGRGIGWASFGKAKTSEQMYMGDWFVRPLTDMEFKPLARMLILVSTNINEAFGLAGDKRLNLRPIADYGNIITIAGILLFIWFLFLPI